MSTPIDAFLKRNEEKDLLRFSTAGSIDDGKSTLIGRMLHDSKNVYEDQIEAVKHATRGREFDETIDFSLLTDGLKAEREQKITIDVAYRYFSTPKRKFIIADTPGHEQYTRNMATGSSTANLSIVLIDARNGLLVQTRRHAFIAALLGVPHLVVAVNKMDLVGYDEAVFDRIRRDFGDFAGKLKVPDVRFIPISALKGDNVVKRSSRMPWYTGESLLEILENVYIASDPNLIDLRFPVQYVLRPDQDFRGYAGQVVSGVIRKGDEVMALPSMKLTRVKSIVTFDGELDSAFPPLSVAVELEDKIDVSRGDMLVHRHNVPHVERHFEAMVVWMSAAPMDVHRPYLVKQTTQVVPLRVDEVRYRTDVNTLTRLPPAALTLNEIGRVVFTATRPLFYDAYERNRATGSFILIDPLDNDTLAAGMIIEREPVGQLPSRMAGLTPEAATMQRRDSQISLAQRVERLGQKPVTVWLTGLVGSGKTQIAFELEERLFALGAACVVLDGENMRRGISRGLGFDAEGRTEHLRRAAETARLLNEAGQIVVCGFASPTVSCREQAAEIVGRDRFLEIYLSAPIEWCAKEDAAGLYRKARAGELRNVPGVSFAYEPPAHPALVLPTHEISSAEAVARILALLRERGDFPARG